MIMDSKKVNKIQSYSTDYFTYLLTDSKFNIPINNSIENNQFPINLPTKLIDPLTSKVLYLKKKQFYERQYSSKIFMNYNQLNDLLLYRFALLEPPQYYLFRKTELKKIQSILDVERIINKDNNLIDKIFLFADQLSNFVFFRNGIPLTKLTDCFIDQHECVCAHFVALYIVFLNKLDIQYRVCIGFGNNKKVFVNNFHFNYFLDNIIGLGSEPHMWIEIYNNNDMFTFDPTVYINKKHQFGMGKIPIEKKEFLKLLKEITLVKRSMDYNYLYQWITYEGDKNYKSILHNYCTINTK